MLSDLREQPLTKAQLEDLVTALCAEVTAAQEGKHALSICVADLD